MKEQSTLFSGVKVKEFDKKKKVLSQVGKLKKPKSTKSKAPVNTVEDVMERVNAHAKKVRERLPEFTFRLCTDVDELMDYLVVAVKNGAISFDTETTGKDEMEDTVVGFSVYTKSLDPIYVPTNHSDYEKNVDAKEFLEKLLEYSRAGKLIVIMANAMFDMRMSRRTFHLNNYIRCMWDVLLASFFLNENDKEHNLKFLWEKYIMNTPEKEIKPDSYKSLFGKYNFGNLNPEKVYVYGSLDALMTYQLYEFQYDYLGRDGKYVKEADLMEAAETFVMWNLLSEPVASMMDNGIGLDMEQLNNTQEMFEAQLESTRLEFDSYVDGIAELYLTPLKENDPELFGKIDFPLNPASPTQLAILFYDAIGLPKINKRSTNVETLETLSRKFSEHKPMFDIIKNYRDISKLKSTYIEGLQKRVNPETNKIHAKFKPYGAVTGRFSSKDPNLQNIPVRSEIGKTIRKMFKPSDGYYLIGSDFSQQEPRILAFLAQDDSMIQAYKDGRDLYADAASRVYDVPYEHCMESFGKEGKKRRDSIKGVILGIMYGRGARSIAEGLNITQGEAKSVISKFYQSFPKVQAYVKGEKAKCQAYGYVKTVWGRKRRLPELNLQPYEITKGKFTKELVEDINKELDGIWDFKVRDSKIKAYEDYFQIKIKNNNGIIAHASRQVVNSEVQGSAADMINQAIVDLYFDEEFNRLGGRLLITVHDEIIAEAPKEYAEAALVRMEQVMVEAGAKKVNVPMKCDGEILERWAGNNIRKYVREQYETQ